LVKHYQFGNLRAGTYKLRKLVKRGWRRTYPTAACYTLTIAAGQSLHGKSFGNKRAGLVALNSVRKPESRERVGEEAFARRVP